MPIVWPIPYPPKSGDVILMDETVVLCCGVFDVLHAGHLQLLEQARSLGSTLVVGINSDESVRKGPGRPVNTADDRASMLRALRVVDRVVVFEEPTPEALIRMLRPDVYVKGGDYTIEALPEALAVQEVGAALVIAPLLEGRSTTGILQRLGVE